MKLFLCSLLAGMWFVSCAPSTPQSRIQRHPEKFAHLTEREKESVGKGELRRGMSKDAVWFVMGAPDRRYEGSKDGNSTERWDYTSTTPVYTNSFYGGFGYGRFGYYDYPYPYYSGVGFGPDIAYVPTHRASVWFVKDRVDSWERAR